MSDMILLHPGAIVSFENQSYKIDRILDFENILAEDVETGKLRQLQVNDLKPVNHNSAKELRPQELSLIPIEDWKEAERWLEIIRPAVDTNRRTIELVKRIADEAGVHPSTVYRKIERYEQTGLTTSLIPSKSSGGRGKSRLSEEVEVILQVLVEEFKKERNPTVSKFYKRLKARCRHAGLIPPHRNTFDNRIKALSQRERDEIRFGPKVAAAMHSTFPGRFPGADFPLAVTQIDHTLLDIILVDDVKHLSVGRPWLTLIMDVYSRMVLGFEISFDPPNSMSVGLCLAHAILPKEEWLAKHDIHISWPCWGFMRKIYADNAGEFRGDMMKRACKEYGMDLEWRVVKTPRYGAHIESLLGTILEEIHTLPGTTFSNPKERGDYDAEKEAVLTQSQFETWLTNYIVGDYHQREHSALGTSPLNQFEKGIFGSKEKPGTGLPPRVFNEDRLRLDLMPFVKRTIQSYGVRIDTIFYHSDVFNRFVGLRDPNNPKKKPKYIFKRNPHNIKFLYFYDPDTDQYIEVTYRNKSGPPMSIWEYRAARKHLKDQGVPDNKINEDIIFETHEKLTRMVEDAKRETKAMRRARQRKSQNALLLRPQTAPLPQEDNGEKEDLEEIRRNLKDYEIDDSI